MTPRRRRMATVAIVLAGVALAVGLALQAFEENLLFFYSPKQVLAGEPSEGSKFRLGGLVMAGSLQREPGDVTDNFQVTDNLRLTARVENLFDEEYEYFSGFGDTFPGRGRGIFGGAVIDW